MQKDGAMKSLYLVIVIYIVFALAGCAPVSPEPPCCFKPYIPSTQAKRKHKDPIAVSVFSKGTLPNKPFVVIGEETVSEYNIAGIKRQEGNIHDTLRKLAASMGGDAVIDVSNDKKAISGKVISYF